MNYRDLTKRELSKVQNLCQKSKADYQKTRPNPDANAQWDACWSRAFKAGADFVEAKQPPTQLFPCA